MYVYQIIPRRNMEIYSTSFVIICNTPLADRLSVIICEFNHFLFKTHSKAPHYNMDLYCYFYSCWDMNFILIHYKQIDNLLVNYVL